MAKYQYQPLDEHLGEIRLVKILPGSGNDLLIIEIHHITLPTAIPQDIQIQTGEPILDGAPRKQVEHVSQTISETLVNNNAIDFEALSYTWGPPEPVESIIIHSETNNQTASQTFEPTLAVGPGLAGALRGLRSPTEARSIWIDAISINQDDITERSKEVPRMGDIYSTATKVVIWLGAEDSNSTKAVQLLDQLGSRLEQSEMAGRTTRYKDSTRLPWTTSDWEAIQELLTRPWFTRIWILQEVQLAREAVVFCGSAQISWKSMKDAIHAVYRNSHVPIAGFRQAIDEADNTVDDFLSYDVEETLVRASSRGATDPKDKIYGALNILSQGVRDRIGVNYDFDVVEIYRNAVLAINDAVHRLNLIGYGVTDEAVDFNGSSWVPRFHAETPFSPKSYHFATGVSASRVQVIDGITIEVTGKLCGTVVEVGLPVPDIHEDLPNFYNMLKTEPSVQHRTEHDLRDDVLKCLVASQLSSRLPDIMDSFSLKELRDMVLSALRSDEEETEAWTEADAVLDRALFTSFGTRLFVTQEGMVGLAPLNVEAGA
ncbi:putative heterokaryon incompatibility [Venturia nashicola]|nr:putative heterokaryon incompatibility [Venturia nashicola]